MSNKLQKSTLPNNHTKNDFKCFGPVATKDGEFSGTKLVDFGCFKQGEVRSNKYYHACVCQSKINSKWYFYVEFGSTGVSTNPQFQFLECSSEAEAQREYEKQCHAKNDKRGQWVTHPVFGKILEPKPTKDCYLVRPLAVRSHGLPDARNITTVNKTVTTIVMPGKKSILDPNSAKLISDLNIGTKEYTRASMVGGTIPTLEAITEARLILDEATKLNNRIKNQKDIINNREIEQLTGFLYSRIPKQKARTIEREGWFLTADNIFTWQQDLDAFENAVKNINTTTTQSMDLPYEILCLKHNDKSKYTFIENWFNNASRNVHHGVKAKVANIWEIKHNAKLQSFNGFINRMPPISIPAADKPLHQISRTDLDKNQIADYNARNVAMLFHGTRTVNVGGILAEGLRLPKTLSGVSINGAMFGDGKYFADDWRKSYGYTSGQGSYWASGSGGIKSRGAFMFISDVCLGKPYIPSRCESRVPSGYHSMFAKMQKSGVANNEFIVFNEGQEYLRYLLELV